MTTEEQRVGSAEPHNRHAGEGAVMLDIGGDIGALVVRMPPALVGHEVEIRPVEIRPVEIRRVDVGPVDVADAARTTPSRLQHVAVLPRPAPSGVVHSAVFGQLRQGRYELYLRPSGAVALTADVHGGQVTFAEWAAGQPLG